MHTTWRIWQFLATGLLSLLIQQCRVLHWLHWPCFFVFFYLNCFIWTLWYTSSFSSHWNISLQIVLSEARTTSRARTILFLVDQGCIKNFSRSPYCICLKYYLKWVCLHLSLGKSYKKNVFYSHFVDKGWGVSRCG